MKMRDFRVGKFAVLQEKVAEKVEMEEMEVGVKSLLEKTTFLDPCHLSQSELESNGQRQEDEHLALQSIYGTDYVSIEIDNSALAAFMINLHLDIGVGIEIVAQAPRNAASGSLIVVDNGNSITVQALPPISLLCVFPPTYPSHSAPLFKLTCLWLSSKKLSSLCTFLDSIWEKTSPEVVVYTWSEWLRSQALHHVGASEKLQLEPDEFSNAEELDDRAVSGSKSFDVENLLRYNEEMGSKKFLESVHTCDICLSEFRGTRFTRLACQHHFCKSCIKRHCNTHVEEGTVLNLTCPGVSCKEHLSPALLRELLDKEAFKRWDELSLQKALDSMPDVVSCPKPKCRTRSIEDPDHLVQCSKCRFSFCSLCMSNWHPGQNCMTPEEKLQFLRRRRQEKGIGKETSEERELINERLNMDYIKKEAKQCPTCRIAVQKSEGCNKMECINCGGYFCFQCGQSIQGYEHFRNSKSCVLMDNLEINRWELQFNLQRFID